MDAARAAMGQGWPFAACSWSADGAREPRQSRGRMVGCPSLWLLSLGQARESNSPVRGETKTKDRHANDLCPDINSVKEHTNLPVRCQSALPPNCAKNQRKRREPAKTRGVSLGRSASGVSEKTHSHSREGGSPGVADFLDCRLRGNDGVFRPSQAMPGLDSSSNQTPLFTLLQMRVRTRSIFSGMASRVYSLSITDSGG